MMAANRIDAAVPPDRFADAPSGPEAAKTSRPVDKTAKLAKRAENGCPEERVNCKQRAVARSGIPCHFEDHHVTRVLTTSR